MTSGNETAEGDAGAGRAQGRPAKGAEPLGFLAIRLVFLMEAVILGAWLPRIPDIKNTLLLSEGVLGICLVGMPLGTLVGFSFAARISHRFGLRTTCLWSGAGFAMVMILPMLAWSATSLFVALFLAGLSIAQIEISMNAKAGQMEQAYGRRIMSQCHGFWSIGTVIGALIGGVFAKFGATPAWQSALAAPIFAVIAVWAATRLPSETGLVPRRKPGRVFVLPPLALLPLCAMPVGIMATEGALMDWSAVFVRDVLGGDPFSAAATYGAFAGAMAVTRLAGDVMATRYGAVRIVMVSSLTAALGIGLFAIAQNFLVAFIGAILAGAGVATVYPLAMSAAAAAPGASSEDNVASVAFVSFSAFLVAPPLIGGLAELFNLRWALGLLVLAALMPVALIRSVTPTKSA